MVKELTLLVAEFVPCSPFIVRHDRSSVDELSAKPATNRYIQLKGLGSWAPGWEEGLGQSRHRIRDDSRFRLLRHSLAHNLPESQLRRHDFLLHVRSLACR